MEVDFLENSVQHLYKYITGKTFYNTNLIRKHSKKLQELGELSFPVNIKSWHRCINKNEFVNGNILNIFEYLHFKEGTKLQTYTEDLIVASHTWPIRVVSCKIIKEECHLFLDKAVLLKEYLKRALYEEKLFGVKNVAFSQINVVLDKVVEGNVADLHLTELRMNLVKNYIKNLAKHSENQTNLNLIISSKSTTEINPFVPILCGPVLNNKGVKDVETTADELFKKRAMDMRMMAQHKYGVQLNPSSPWHAYFQKLGKESVTLEMLQCKLSKDIKISLHDLSSSNKGASFIFYNCARFAALLREFDSRVKTNVYSELPPFASIDLTLLNQQEEWELIYVYIVQFPELIKSTARDLDKGIINAQYLIAFLSNLCSLFSVYYRRVRILTESRQHLIPVLHARIYFLKAIQQVLHNSLMLLDIDPIKEM